MARLDFHNGQHASNLLSRSGSTSNCPDDRAHGSKLFRNNLWQPLQRVHIGSGWSGLNKWTSSSSAPGRCVFPPFVPLKICRAFCAVTASDCAAGCRPIPFYYSQQYNSNRHQGACSIRGHRESWWSLIHGGRGAALITSQRLRAIDSVLAEALFTHGCADVSAEIQDEFRRTWMEFPKMDRLHRSGNPTLSSSPIPSRILS